MWVVADHLPRGRALKRDRGATLVLVTHDLNLARLCDRMVRLRSGQVEAGAASAVA